MQFVSDYDVKSCIKFPGLYLKQDWWQSHLCSQRFTVIDKDNTPNPIRTAAKHCQVVVLKNTLLPSWIAASHTRITHGLFQSWFGSKAFIDSYKRSINPSHKTEAKWTWGSIHPLSRIWFSSLALTHAQCSKMSRDLWSYCRWEWHHSTRCSLPPYPQSFRWIWRTRRKAQALFRRTHRPHGQCPCRYQRRPLDNTVQLYTAQFNHSDYEKIIWSRNHGITTPK